MCLGTRAQLSDALEPELNGLATESQMSAHFSMIEPAPYSSMASITATCHAGLVGYTGSLAYASFPNRLFEYMALGLPVLAPVESPLIQAVIRDYGCGLTYSNSDTSSLVAAIDLLYLNPELALELGDRARVAYLDHFAWERQFDNVLRLL
jgi:glycosyltransferase involved in cell wall biosynthesis